METNNKCYSKELCFAIEMFICGKLTWWSGGMWRKPIEDFDIDDYQISFVWNKEYLISNDIESISHIRDYFGENGERWFNDIEMMSIGKNKIKFSIKYNRVKIVLFAKEIGVDLINEEE